MRPLRIAFSDFVVGADPANWECIRIISEQRPLEVADFEKADLLFYSDFGERHW
jgi:hypothetical protein